MKVITSNKDLLDMIGGYAERVIETAGTLIPTFFLISPDGKISIIAAPWSSDQEQDMALAVIREKIVELPAERYGFVSEAWMVKRKDGDPRIQPKDAPDRTEVVTHGVVDQLGFRLSRVRQIVRAPETNAPSLDAPEDGGSPGGKLFSLFGQGAGDAAAGRYH